MKLRVWMGLGIMCGPLAACTTRAAPIRFGTTYTVEQSGALAAVESLWARRDGRLLATVIGPSGQILHSAAGGDLDVVLTHAPELEARLLAAGASRLRCPVAVSQFAVVGPERDPAHVRGARTAREAMRRIARAQAVFVSRGDSSGTHTRERQLWALARTEPTGSWYFESGSDQAANLRMASEWGGYALADLPTFTRTPGLALAVLFSGDSALENPYTAYVAAEAPAQADTFARWLGDSGRAAFTALRLARGTAAFAPPPTARCAAPPPPAVAAKDAAPLTPAPRSPLPAPASRDTILLGQWEYTTPRLPMPAEPTLNTGLRVTIVFDSLAAGQARGRVTFWFSGDVGVDPALYGPVTGTVSRDGKVAISIPLQSGARPPLEVTGRIAGDTLFIEESRRGSDAGPFAAGPRGRFIRTARRPSTSSP